MDKDNPVYVLAVGSITFSCRRWTFCETADIWVRRDEEDAGVWRVTVYKDFDKELSALSINSVDVVISGNSPNYGDNISLKGTIRRSTLIDPEVKDALHWMTGFITNFDVHGDLEAQEVEPIRRIRFSRGRLS